jgi:alpha/beta superfamily hydrolase
MLVEGTVDSMTPAAAISTFTFDTSDGVSLTGDLVIPAQARAAAIVCHPHPQYGGNRHDHVVGALFEAFAAADIAALRFDFRQDFDDGHGETLDAIAAIDALVHCVPDVPIIATGYSFGAAIVLGLDDGRISAKVLVAPPLAVMPASPGMAVPTLVLTPALDQFSPPEKSGPIVAGWANATHETIPSADHFLTGHTAAVADRAVAWLAPFRS